MVTGENLSRQVDPSGARAGALAEPRGPVPESPAPSLEAGEAPAPPARTRRIGMSRQLAVTFVGLGIALLAVLGMGYLRAASESRVEGVLTSMEARGLGDVGSITLLTAQGKEVRLLVDPSVGSHWTPGHVRDHMIGADPLTVYYRRAGQDLVAYRIVSRSEGERSL